MDPEKDPKSNHVWLCNYTTDLISLRPAESYTAFVVGNYNYEAIDLQITPPHTWAYKKFRVTKYKPNIIKDNRMIEIISNIKNIYKNKRKMKGLHKKDEEVLFSKFVEPEPI